jgi:hypothetical protein
VIAATEQPTAQDSQAVEYHYIISIQARGGLASVRDGFLMVPPGNTRAECYRFLLKQMQEEFGAFSLLFFSLEPNQLAVGGVR